MLKSEYNKLISEIVFLQKEIEDFKRTKPNFVKRLELILSKKQKELEYLRQSERN